jgi:hypothetical protein
MEKNDFGRLEEINLRAGWLDEARDFTPWLAQTENLEILGDALGMELEPVSTEQGVGPYKADILAIDPATNTYVLIENQLEKTDHSHLGQIITYSAGLEAKTIVWIARRFTDEHRAALDWLNQISEESINFFGIEVELWKIGNSSPAPRFNVVSKPNEWTKSIHASRQPSKLTDSQGIQLEYWSGFNEFLESACSKLKPRKPYPQNWIAYGIGKSGFTLAAKINQRENWIDVEIWVAGRHRDAYFQQLKENFELTAAEKLDHQIEWIYRPDRIDHLIRLVRPMTDPANTSGWPEQHAWIEKNLRMFREFFSPIIKSLNVPEGGN